jgi:alpha-L-arabinofuranosidase
MDINMKEEANKQATLRIRTKEKGVQLGDLYGIFFEDLNHAADGGLYAELVQNRSFEFDPIDNKDYQSLTAWEKIERGNGKAEICVEETNPLNKCNTHYLAIDVIEPGDGVGIMNLGYNIGIPLKQGENYNFSCYARCDRNLNETIRVTLESANGKVYAQSTIAVNSAEWTKYEVTITANTTDYSSRLVITTMCKGKLYLDMVSLFPENTFKNRPNGLREDIAQIIADLKPKFMRFPGGCLIHDGSLDPDARDSMYRWKNTIGDIEQRPARRNGWGYNQTLGLGYYEYFQFCEDIGAKPIPILPGGCDPHHKRCVPIEELQPWIDDALDLIEFANGDMSTKWGRKRAELGHPEPFGLEYIGIGNEEVGKPFFERYSYFHKAIKEKYPDIKIINSSGPFAAGSEYDRGWKSAKENKSDLIDEHYYQTPEWFLANYHRYDDFKVDEPKVFLGEYATWGNTYYNALVEAAYMTGFEKNAHAVSLACYAPMLCNVDYVNWKPDMIWFNNHGVYCTANYYVQKMFMNHQGDNLLQVEASGLEQFKPLKDETITGKISISGDQVDAEFYDIKLKNWDTGEEKTFSDISVDTCSDVIEIAETNWENYSLSFKGKRISGKKGFFLYFGEKDIENRLRWAIGGWENQDSLIAGFVNQRVSCLTQSIFNVETDREYNLELEVQGRRIRSYIDGELINDTEDKLPVIETLYYSASLEATTNDVIIKVVNVQAQSVTTQVVLDGMQEKVLDGMIFEMSGYELDAENSFEAPELISSKQKNFSVNGNVFAYEFPKQSITIFRFYGSCR